LFKQNSVSVLPIAEKIHKGPADIVLEFVGEMHGLSRSEARQRAGELLEELALADASEEFAVAWLAALAIAAAPVFEEFIFRGLVFGGLRRSFGPAAATLASAAIFAIVHPPMSVIPVFLMGVCAALIYERTKLLAAPMTVHAVYNAAVLGFQWNVMQ
jgi:membrane protease YdiL (CAAX protease family)